MSNENPKSNQNAIVPAGQPLPAVHVEELSQNELDEVEGGCLYNSCGSTCGNTGGGKDKLDA